MSLCLYIQGQITKAIICLKFKSIHHAQQGDNSYIKDSMKCKNQMFFREKLVSTLETEQHMFMKKQFKS